MSNFTISFADGDQLRWVIWDSFPHVSVIPAIAFQNGKSSQEWKSLLEEGMQKSFSLGAHRAFIFFLDVSEDTISSISNEFKSGLSYEIFHEIILTGKNLKAYDYKGLPELVSEKNPSKVQILSLAPSRTFQAKMFGLYHEDEATFNEG